MVVMVDAAAEAGEADGEPGGTRNSPGDGPRNLVERKDRGGN